VDIQASLKVSNGIYIASLKVSNGIYILTLRLGEQVRDGIVSMVSDEKALSKYPVPQREIQGLHRQIDSLRLPRQHFSLRILS
jgi:hypothetical protein